MRVAILGVQIPFSTGGAEILVDGLRREIERAGHVVDVLTLPFNDVDHVALLASCAAWRSLSLEQLPDGPVDLVIATKFPSYLVRHPRKILWLIHQYRGIYEFTGTSYTNVFPDRRPDAALRATLLDMDRRALQECRQVFTISRTVSERLRDYNGIDGRCLYHPPRIAGRFGSPAYGDFLLAVSRLERNKRIDLLVEAMDRARGNLRCKIVGEGSQEPHLRFLIEQHRLEDRVELTGAVGDDDLLRLYSECRAVYFAPFDEDYGYVTLEAFGAGKAVITAKDSGGVLEFVEDGKTGLVVPPEPDSIAAAIDRLASDLDLARRLGEAGRGRVSGITWSGVAKKLLELE